MTHRGQKIQGCGCRLVRPSLLTAYTLLLLLPGFAFAQTVATENDPVVNTGTITTSSDDAPGILSTGTGTITNEGEVSTGRTRSPGLRSEGDGDIINAASGTITTTGIDSHGISSTGAGTITNEGEITSSGRGIFSTGTGDITNEGEITSVNHGIYSTENIDQIINSGRIESSFGRGIFSRGVDTTIINRGTIISLSRGIELNGLNATVTNAAGGMIRTSGNFAHGILSRGAGGLTNNSTITTTGANAAGIISSGDGDVTNHGMITSAGHGIELQGADARIFNDGTITTTRNEASGIFSSGLRTTIINSDTISVEGNTAHGILSTGANAEIDNTGTITITGDEDAYGIYSFGPGANITNDGVVSTSGIRSYGIVSFDADQRINGTITTTGDQAHGILALGNSEITINGTVSATGRGSDAVRGSDEEDQTLILGAGALIEGGLDLGEREGDNDVLDIEANPRRSLVIRGVDTLRSGAAPVLQSGDTVAVLDMTGPTATRTTLGAMTGQIRRQVFQRLDSRRLSRGAAAKRDAWGGLFGMVSDRDEDEMALAWEHSLYGVSGGVDMLLDSGQRVGVFAGVGRNRVRTEVTSIRDTATHGFVGAYGQQPIGEFNLDGAVIFGYGRHDSDRAVTGDGVANGKYDNFYVSPSLSLKWFKELGEGVEFRPRAEISYTYGDFSGYTERETTHSNISFKGRSVHITDGRLELALARTFNDDQGEIEVRGGATFTHFGEDSLGASLDNGPSVSYRITGENTIRGGFGGIRIRYQITDSVTMNGDLEYVVNSGGAESIGGNMWLDGQF